jgi:bifunctional pyridoxal-dependent enzyme with beta-cystathionase and maltose regulon repressor activities
MQVFTNPNNPLGRTYPKETILAVAKFAQERDMYLVVNEIYANSVYDNEGEFCRFPSRIDRGRFSEISAQHPKEVSSTKSSLSLTTITAISSQLTRADWPEAPAFVSALSIDFEREVPGFDMARLSGELIILFSLLSLTPWDQTRHRNTRHEVMS